MSYYLKKIKNSLTSIQFIDLKDNMPLKQKIIIKFSSRVLEELQQIFNINKQDSEYAIILEEYLHNKWQEGKNNFLCYTAMPDSQILEIFCDIAEFVCSEKNKKLSVDDEPFAPIQILMPGVNFESYHSDYLSLSPIKKINFNNDEYESVISFLLRNKVNLDNPEIIFSEEEKETKEKLAQIDFKLIHNYIDQYLAILEKAKLKLSSDFKNKLEIEKRISLYQKLKDQKVNYEEQKALIASGRLERINENYLKASISIKNILESHIISFDRSSLIPVSVILNDANLRPYEPYSKNQTKTFSNEAQNDEFSRLNNHSLKTFGIYSQQILLEKLKDDKSCLLGHIRELLKKLRLNDAHSGFGSATNAGKDAYEAIRVFNEYYENLGYKIQPIEKFPEEKEQLVIYIKVENIECNNGNFKLKYAVLDKNDVIHEGILSNEDKLDAIKARIVSLKKYKTNLKELFYEELKDFKNDILSILIQRKHANLENEEKLKIPVSLKSELDTILGLVKDPKKNINAVENMQTCIWTIQKRIIPIVEANHLELAKIHTSSERHYLMINKIEMDLAQSKKEMLLLIDNYQYSGKDNLPIKKEFIDKYKVFPQLKSLGDLDDILSMDAFEAIEIAANDVIKRSIVSFFRNKSENLFDFIISSSTAKLNLLFKIAPQDFLLQTLSNLNIQSVLFAIEGNIEKYLLLLKEIFNKNIYHSFFVNNPDKYEMLKEEIKILDKDSLLKIILNQNISIINYANPSFVKDEKFILSLIPHKKEIFKYADDSLKNNRDFILAAVSQNGLVLEYVDDIFKKDISLVLAAVRQNGFAFKFADHTLRKDKKYIESMMLENLSSFGVIDEYLRKDADYVLSIIKKNTRVYPYIDCYLRDNKNFLIHAIKQNSEVVKYLSYDLIGNKYFVLSLLKINPEIIKYVHLDLNRNSYFLLDAISVNPMVFKYIPNNQKKYDLNFILSAIKRNNMVKDFLDDFIIKNSNLVITKVNQAIYDFIKQQEMEFSDKSIFNCAYSYKIPEELKEIIKVIKNNSETALEKIDKIHNILEKIIGNYRNIELHNYLYILTSNETLFSENSLNESSQRRTLRL